MATRFWRGTAIKRHFSSWGARTASGRMDAPPKLDAAHGLEPAVEQAARHSDYPDVGVYDRPATTRMTPANLSLSIVLLVVAIAVLGAILWTVFR